MSVLGYSKRVAERLTAHMAGQAAGSYLSVRFGNVLGTRGSVLAEGEVLGVLVQSKRNKHAALKLMRKLLKKYAFVPERLVTDDLRSYSAAVRESWDRTPPSARAMEEQSAAENSHQPTRRRERKKQRFKGPGSAAEIPFHTRRRLQHFQRPTPSHLGSIAPDATRRGDEHVARGRRCGVRVPAPKRSITLVPPQRDNTV